MKSSSLIRNLDPSNLVLLLQSWRLWLLGAVLGTLVGVTAFQFLQPSYQAEAIVSIDFNLEQAWIFPLDKSEYIYVGREVQKLELIAWSDETMHAILKNNPNYSIEELVLNLDKSSEGAWGFLATANNKADAENIVSSWVLAFEEEVIARISTTAEIEQARYQITQYIATSPNISTLEIEQAMKEIMKEIKSFSGISPFIEIDIIQMGKINSSFQVPIAIYMLLGSFLGVFTTFFVSILKMNNENKK